MSSCAIPQKSPPCSIHVPLHEHETAGTDFSSWPQAVQNIHTRELDLWAMRNPDLDIVEQAHAIDPVRKICITQWHTAPRAPAPEAAPAPVVPRAPAPQPAAEQEATP